MNANAARAAETLTELFHCPDAGIDVHLYTIRVNQTRDGKGYYSFLIPTVPKPEDNPEALIQNVSRLVARIIGKPFHKESGGILLGDDFEAHEAVHLLEEGLTYEVIHHQL